MSDLLQIALEWLASGLFGRRGPLEVTAERRAGVVVLTLVNRGRRSLAFAAVRATDGSGSVFFPAVDLLVRSPLEPGRAQVVSGTSAEPRLVDGTPLCVLDTSGKAWPARWVGR
ncbi:hypothetical protein [Rohdeia mirabilis]